MRPTDEQLRELLDKAREYTVANCSCDDCELYKTVSSVITELLERRAADRNADSRAAELKRWNAED